MPTGTDGLGEFVVERGNHQTFAAGDYLFHEGDRSLSVYACVRGRIRICVTSPTGRELTLGLKLPGQEFGELSSLDERPRSAAAVAHEDSVVAKMSARDFIAGLHERPDLAIAILRNLAMQLRRANARLSAQDSDSILVRVGTRLLELSDLYRRHAGTVTRVELPITQSELASWVGATRESTSRALSELRGLDLVHTGRGRIVVLDVDGLEEAVRSA